MLRKGSTIEEQKKFLSEAVLMQGVIQGGGERGDFPPLRKIPPP